MSVYNPRIFSRVQPVHRRVTGIGASDMVGSRRRHAGQGFSQFRIGSYKDPLLRSTPSQRVKITQNPCWAGAGSQWQGRVSSEFDALVDELLERLVGTRELKRIRDRRLTLFYASDHVGITGPVCLSQISR